MRAALRETLPLSALFAATFGVCYCTASWLAMRHASLPAWNLPFEQHVPFMPSMAVVYLTIIPALLLAPFLFRTREELAPLVATLCAETLIATAFFLAVPLGSAFVRPPVGGWVGPIFRFADALNLESNQFPSLHVAFACTAAWAYARRGGRAGKLLWALWCATVSVSAWLIWEHHFVDLIGGAMLAWLCVAVFYERDDVPEAIWIESCCLVQCARFSMRHVRYFVIFVAIWGPSLLRWRERRVVRVAFCSAQWIDDLLDGDRRSEREPLDVIDELLAMLDANADRRRDPLSRLTAALFRELSDGAKQRFLDLVREMRIDRVRVLGAERWSEAELDAHHRRTFALSVDVMLEITGCRARAVDVPALIEALAWCSTFRDLEDDLRRGLINIPREVKDVEAWARERHARALDDLAASAAAIARLGDPQSRRILGVFQRSIARYATRVKSATQFVSHVLPPSSENACSQRAVVAEMLDQMKRT